MWYTYFSLYFLTSVLSNLIVSHLSQSFSFTASVCAAVLHYIYSWVLKNVYGNLHVVGHLLVRVMHVPAILLKKCFRSWESASDLYSGGTLLMVTQDSDCSDRDVWFTSVSSDEWRVIPWPLLYYIHSVHYSPSSYHPKQYSSSYWWLINHK